MACCRASQSKNYPDARCEPNKHIKINLRGFVRANEGGINLSVLKTDRNPAPLDYASKFDLLCEYIDSRLSRVKKKKKKWLNAPIERIINQASSLIALARYDNPQNLPSDNREYIKQQVAVLLTKLQPYLWILFSVRNYPEQKMGQMISMINNEINLLVPDELQEVIKKLTILDIKSINKARYLKCIVELQRYIHGKVIRAPRRFDFTTGSRLVTCVDNAMISAIYANKIYPTCHDEYMERRKYIEYTISYLNSLQKESYSFFIQYTQSDAVISEWSKKIVYCIKALHAIKKSDASRFKEFK